jgi:hypothetical protein
MRIRFLPEPIQVKFARVGAGFGGLFVTSVGIQSILATLGGFGHDHLRLLPGIAALLWGPTLLHSAVMGTSDRLARMRARIEEEKLPPAERKSINETDQIKAIKTALYTIEE